MRREIDNENPSNKELQMPGMQEKKEEGVLSEEQEGVTRLRHKSLYYARKPPRLS